MWETIGRDVGLGADGFEAMLDYDDSLTHAVITSAGELLKCEKTTFLEGLGTYLVSHPSCEAVRRLLRFGGRNFIEFLLSLDDLHDRAKLALPDLDLPRLATVEHASGSFSLFYRWDKPGFASVVLGVVRAMADDYGALVLIELATGEKASGDEESLTVDLLDARFSAGRKFDLAVRPTW